MTEAAAHNNSHYQSAGRRPLRRFLLLILGTLLAWEVVSRSLVAHLADQAPEAAIQLREDPAALLRVIEQAAIEPGSTDKMDRALKQARSALKSDPLNAHAFRVLGQLAESGGDKGRAADLMAAAARRSLHESDAVYWLMLHHYEQQNMASAAFYADILMRT